MGFVNSVLVVNVVLPCIRALLDGYLHFCSAVAFEALLRTFLSAKTAIEQQATLRYMSRVSPMENL